MTNATATQPLTGDSLLTLIQSMEGAPKASIQEAAGYVGYLATTKFYEAVMVAKGLLLPVIDQFEGMTLLEVLKDEGIESLAVTYNLEDGLMVDDIEDPDLLAFILEELDDVLPNSSLNGKVLVGETGLTFDGLITYERQETFAL
jgi:hypothetical protein